MGIAAYNRGSRLISKQIATDRRRPEFDVLERLALVPKAPDAPIPFGPIHFVPCRAGCWAMCPTTGFGYLYANTTSAVKSWRVEVTTVFMRSGEVVYLGVPMREEESSR